MKWLQVLLFNTNYSISTLFIHLRKVNGSKYYYVLPIIQYRHTVKEFKLLLFNTNYSIQHYSFVFTQRNGSKYCYVSLKIQFNSLSFTHS